MKRINPHHKTEKQGLNELQSLLTELGWIFRPTPNDDYGIDGEIEPVVEASPSGRLLKVQVKSGTSYVRPNGADEFYFLASADDLQYWSTGSLPVLLVVFDPGRKELYWKWIQAYLRSDPNALSMRKIWFNRNADRLNTDRSNDLIQIATGTVTLDSVSIVVTPHSEVLWSNLLKVNELPRLIYSVSTLCKTPGEVRSKLVNRPKPPCIVKNGRLFAFSNLHVPDNPLLQVSSLRDIKEEQTSDWEKHEEKVRWLVELMNSALRKKCAHIGLQYDKEKARFYFQAKGPKSIVVRYRAMTRWIKRKVAYPYPDGNPRFWVHHATRLRFVHMGHWFLMIDPAWVFTKDGQQLLVGQRVGTLATRRKAREYNQTVLNHLVFWREILSEGQASILVYPAQEGQSLEVSKTFADGIGTFGLRGDFRNLSQLEEATEFEVIDDEGSFTEEGIFDEEAAGEA